MTLAVDSSAVVAVVRHEPGAAWLVDQLEAATVRVITTATALEIVMVLEGRNRPNDDGDGLTGEEALTQLDIRTVDLDDALWKSAAAAWRRFGKGRHPAALNYGDCFSYALARTRDVPLLCLGDRFKQTDLEVWAP